MSVLELDLLDVMDKVVVDDWGAVRPGRPVRRAASRRSTRGWLTAETLHAELGESSSGPKPGRERDDERILFWHRGLATTDVAVAGADRRARACRRSSGTSLRYRS